MSWNNTGSVDEFVFMNCNGFYLRNASEVFFQAVADADSTVNWLFLQKMSIHVDHSVWKLLTSILMLR